MKQPPTTIWCRLREDSIVVCEFSDIMRSRFFWVANPLTPTECDMWVARIGDPTVAPDLIDNIEYHYDLLIEYLEMKLEAFRVTRTEFDDMSKIMRGL